MREINTEMKLSFDEGMAVAAAAVVQQFRATSKGLKRDHGVIVPERGEARRMGERINGMMAEYALCKKLDVSWHAGVAGLKTGDICGNRLFVRATDMNTGHLMITAQEARDFPDAAYALMVGFWPMFRLAGWCWVRDAVQDRWFRRRGDGSTIDAYWIPQAGSGILHDFEALREFADSWRSAA